MKHARLCICGRSKTPPLCDNSHESEDWSCSPPAPTSAWGFCASYSHQNLARRLAATLRGVACEPHVEVPRVGTMVWLVGQHDLAWAAKVFEQGAWDRGLVLSLDGSGGLLQEAFGGCQVMDVPDQGALRLFGQVRGLLEGIERGEAPGEGWERAAPEQLRSGFVCHAVADERVIDPVVISLRRHFGAQIFVCSDSIGPGVDWQARITDALRACEVFLLLVSKASAASTFCAFEVGMARALGKPMVLCSLDGSPPPAYVQHLQAVDLVRRRAQRPWLGPDDALLTAMLEGLRGG